MPPSTWFLLIEPSELAEEGKFYLERMDRPQGFHAVRPTLEEIYKFPSVTASGVPSGSMETTAHLEFESVERFSGEIGKVRDELDKVSEGHEVFVVCETDAECERLGQLFVASKLLAAGQLHFVVGHMEAGFRIVPQRIMLVSAAELFQRQDLARTTRRRQARAIDSFLELREGDLVVHVAHGIGRYRGLRLLEKDDRAEEHLELEYHGGTKIYVPAAQDRARAEIRRRQGRQGLTCAHRRQGMGAAEGGGPAGGDRSGRRDDRAAGGPRCPAGHRIPAGYANGSANSTPRSHTRKRPTSSRRSTTSSATCTRPGRWTGCCAATSVSAKRNWRSGRRSRRSMPATKWPCSCRRRCWPSSIAARSARGWPSSRSRLPRYRGSARRRNSGKSSSARPTGRSTSSSARTGWRRPTCNSPILACLIIDEEQRFGVEIKERLKALRATVDVLTMTATPIPRTLHMSLLGVRAISNLETPPADRLAVETRVTRFSDELVRHAIMRELNRGGQIYFVHNRINDIHAVAMRLAEIVPEAQIDIGHGQMPEHELEDVMLRFVRGETDILLSTTIVESGLDIPNANTIFIDDADRYGLADLHQLRGRVGRYKHRAYCYLLVDENRHLVAGGRAAAAGDRGIQPDGRRLRPGDARPGTARRRQHSGHATERAHRHGGLRNVLRAVGAGRAAIEAAAAAGIGRREYRSAGRSVLATRRMCPTCDRRSTCIAGWRG